MSDSALVPYPRFKAFDPTTGGFLAAGKLYTYLAGTSTPKATYSVQDGSNENPNPVQLNGAGEADVWLGSGAYKFVLRDAYDVVIWTVDNIQGPVPGSFSVVTISGALTVSGTSALQALTATTISASGQITSTVSVGTAPFVIPSGAANVPNLDASKLLGSTWAAPAALGSTTPAAVSATTLSASGTSNLTGHVTALANVLQQTANGGQWIRGQISEEITLSLVGATTDSVADMLLANSIIEAVTARVTATIATATDWKLGDAVQAARFLAATTDLVIGTTKVGLAHADPTVATANLGPVQSAAAKLRVTCTGTPTAGKIRITVFFRQFVAPTS